MNNRIPLLGDIVSYENKLYEVVVADYSKTRIKGKGENYDWIVPKNLKIVQSDWRLTYSDKNCEIYEYDNTKVSNDAYLKLRQLKLREDKNSSLTSYIKELRSKIKDTKPRILSIDKNFNSVEFHNSRINAIKGVRMLLRKARESRKAKKILTRRLYLKNDVIEIKIVDGFWDKESVKMALSRRKLAEFFNAKTPKTLEKHVGVELEFLSKLSRDELSFKILKLNKLWLSEYVNFGTDGSISVNEEFRYGIEARVLAPQDKIEYVIKELCEALGDDVSINKSCGFHVHLDMRERDVEKSFWNLVTCQKLLFDMQPSSRKNNTYCKKTIGKVFMYKSGSRYKAINKESYRTKRTLEVRLHSGTVNFEKINNFVNLLIRIVDSDKIERAPRTRQKLYEKLNLPLNLRMYIEKRIELFKNDALTENSVSTTLSVAA
jgi:hypothetical protein